MEKISWTDHVRNEEVLLRVKEQRNILHEIRNLDASGRRSETLGKFCNVVLEKDGEDQLDRSCEK
jgi:hypothetical protein